MDLNSSFKTAQSKFYDWTTKWAKDGENTENNRAPDLVDLITIFQILGFSVTHTDAVNPLEMSMLSCGERGLKLNLSCGHSGVRFVVERANVCSCPQKMTENVQQIMNADKDEKNKSCDEIRLLDVPVGEKIVIQTVLNHLVNMMHSAASENDQNENLLSKENKENLIELAQTPKKKELSSENFFTPSQAVKQTQKKSPELPTSPARFRSLDSLQDKTQVPDDLPEPGKLVKLEKNAENKPKVPVVTLSSPNLNILPKLPINTSSPVANMTILKQGYSKLLCVQEMVKDVIDILEKSQELPKFSIDISKITASTESIYVQKQIFPISNSDPSLVRRSVRPLGRPSIRSVSSSSKNNTAATSSSNSIKPTSTGRKSSENISPTFKVTNRKYAHVKSTIPKGNVSKK